MLPVVMCNIGIIILYLAEGYLYPILFYINISVCRLVISIDNTCFLASFVQTSTFWYLCWDLLLFLFFHVLFSIFLLNSMFTSLFWFSISHILILGFLKCAECPPLHCSIWYFYVWKIYFGGWLFFSFVFKRLSQLSFYIQMLVST